MAMGVSTQSGPISTCCLPSIWFSSSYRRRSTTVTGFLKGFSNSSKDLHSSTCLLLHNSSVLAGWRELHHQQHANGHQCSIAIFSSSHQFKRGRNSSTASCAKEETVDLLDEQKSFHPSAKWFSRMGKSKTSSLSSCSTLETVLPRTNQRLNPWILEAERVKANRLRTCQEIENHKVKSEILNDQSSTKGKKVEHEEANNVSADNMLELPSYSCSSVVNGLPGRGNFYASFNHGSVSNNKQATLLETVMIEDISKETLRQGLIHEDLNLHQETPKQLSCDNNGTKNWGNPTFDYPRKVGSSVTQTLSELNGAFSHKPIEYSEEKPSTGARSNETTKRGPSNRKSTFVNGEPVETYVEPINPYEEDDIRLLEHRKRLECIYHKVLVVDNISVAKDIVRKLTTQYKDLVYACDTEVANIDVKQETPVDHGEVICFSIYSGPTFDLGNGKSCIWVDVLDGGGSDILKAFAPFFEDPSIRKVWHNYSFDRHVIENYGLKLSGFYADTMHMARLWDSSRQLVGGYSLEALTRDPKIMSSAQKCSEGELIGKISMKKIFGKKKIKKDGSEGKLIAIPPVEELQRKERVPWICYSALDSISTRKLFESLQRKLISEKWIFEGFYKGSMYDFYEEYWRPFGELLVQMETEGMLVDRAYLAEMEKLATVEKEVAQNRFRKWASRYCPDSIYMNVGSDAQLRQLFFGGITNRKDPNESLPLSRTFKIPNVDNVIEEGKKVARKYRNITLHNLGAEIQSEIYTATGWPSVSGDALKVLAGKVAAESDLLNDANETLSDGNDEFSLDQIVNEVEEKQANCVNEENTDTSIYGTAYAAFGEGKEGREACQAIAALCEVCSIDSLISNFILPLQGTHISGKDDRVHCSLNINTETGRLSARRPNLQNQPALEKDRYKIRQAFIAAPGNSLIVADYGQLELRILAHLANCKSMLEAFKAGGDFHSRTAMNMYPHIREAVEQKRVLLEWQPQAGEEKPPAPLLKDEYASERRKAKMLNFSIAYGKTPVGLARDWKVSVKEAKETVALWYKERKEVLKWQEERKKEAQTMQRVHTLLGRARHFPSMAHASRSQQGHIERAAINTPVQGSAADVAMCAMLEISRNARLKELGWKLLLQVHDEVILEGPKESAEAAKAIVVECMSKPFYGRNFLKVELSVDAKCAQNWYAAK